MHSSHFHLLTARLNDARSFLEGAHKLTTLALSHSELQIGASNRFNKLAAEYVLHACYVHLSEYLRRILRGMFDHDPLLVAGKAPGKLDYHEIVTLGSYAAIGDHIVEQVFRRLESQRSTTKLLQRLLEHTGVEVNESVQKPALMYLEARHLLVHNSGTIDAAFLREFAAQLKFPARVGGKLQLNRGFARAALGAIARLAGAVDTGLVEGGYLPAVNASAPQST